MLSLLLFQWRLEQASNFAPVVDRLFDFILWFSIISFLIIVFGMVLFTFKYWRKKIPENRTAYITGHTKLELGVAFFLLVVVMVIFYWGWVDYKAMKNPPHDAFEVNVIGRQWLWQFQYADGKMLTNELIVPKDKAVSLIMTSEDVLHSLYIPDFRIKQDVLPKSYTNLWFVANRAGEFPIFCAEYCGTAHSAMLGKVKVLEQDDFERWQMTGKLPVGKRTMDHGQGTMDQQPDVTVGEKISLADKGRGLFASKGCTACHSVTGAAGVGPAVNKIFGKEVELTDGKKTKVDENYIRQSVNEPQARIVKGYQPIMPTFKGQISEEEMNALIAYIKSLK
ncbi:MAG: cytochrome c oxidase subunit II [Deltaproteobacteria bacterium]|nr:cytochrome c oxidase subunit II [Deltaproteobacteria bacterium]